MKNTGYYNTGYYNTGDHNTGKHNTGDYNTGGRNTGKHNTGYYNTGKHNTGYYNTGYYNTGYYNTGDHNTGDHNTGDHNTGKHNTGDCNTNNPTVRLFNCDSSWEFFGENHNRFRSIIYKVKEPLREWVATYNMSDKEKKDNPTYKTTGGYLKVNEEMKNNIEISKEDREFLLAVPNFNNEILKECTGIDLENEKVKIIIDGKEIWISKESATELKEQL